MPTLSLDSSKLTAALNKAAQVFIAAAQRFASYSTRIPKAIKQQQPKVVGNEASVLIYVDPNEAPHAVAKEYGAGLHRTIGTPSTYSIEPKNAGALKFVWPKFFENPAQGMSQGKVLSTNVGERSVALSRVDHPGSEAKPFMDPAKRQTENEIGEIISEVYSQEIETTITDLFTKAGFKEI